MPRVRHKGKASAPPAEQRFQSDEQERKRHRGAHGSAGNGRSVAVLRAVDYGHSCIVEAEVYPTGARSAAPSRPGPYTFADAQQATAFVTEAVEALMILGCDVHAQ